MLDSAEVKRALAKGAAERRAFGGLEYIRFRSPHKDMERGTVITRQGFYPGFPHIKRIFTLARGLERNITDDEVFAEEKIDGYNLRTVNVGGKIYGLSRGGIIDAFSTEKLNELVEPEIIEGLMLCGEMVGNTPYTRPTRDYDIKYYVFDVYDLKGGSYLAPDEKYAFLKKNGLDSIPRLGKFSKTRDAKKLDALVLNVNKARKEGIVFKSADRNQVVKYVNPNADIEDIGNAVKQIFDMPIGYLNQRILRSAIFMKDYGLGIEEYGDALGKHAYGKLIEGLKMVEKEGCVYDEFEICVKDRGAWEELKSHMGKEVRLEKAFERKEGAKVRIRFRKIYIRSTKKLKEFLNGKGITD